MEEAAGGGDTGGQNGIRTKRAGASLTNGAPAFFAFMGPVSSSVGLLAWKSACAPLRCGNG